MPYRTAILQIPLASSAGILVAAQPTAQQVELFEKQIRLILVEHCYECHSAEKKQKGGLSLDTRAATGFLALGAPKTAGVRSAWGAQASNPQICASSATRCVHHARGIPCARRTQRVRQGCRTLRAGSPRFPVFLEP
jgi:hypothetical protein